MSADTINSSETKVMVASAQESSDQQPTPIGTTFKSIGLVSLLFFGSGGLILLLTLAQPMAAWLLIGWFIFLPFYLLTVTGGLTLSLVSKNQNKLVNLWIGLILGIISIALVGADFVKHTGIYHTQDTSGYGGSFTAVLFAVSGCILAYGGFKRNKVLATIIFAFCGVPFCALLYMYLSFSR